jgi:hypothetical protein
VDWVSTPDPPPDTQDLRGLARSLRLLFEFGTQALLEDSEPSELAVRISGHLGCELTAIVVRTARQRAPSARGHPGADRRSGRAVRGARVQP